MDSNTDGVDSMRMSSVTTAATDAATESGYVPRACAWVPPLGHLEKCSVLSGVDISLYAIRLGSSGNASPAVHRHIQGQPLFVSTHTMM